MELFSKEVCTFLNNLDSYIPTLLKQQTANIIDKNVLFDINAMMLYANEYAILNRIAQLTIKKLFSIDKIVYKTSSFVSSKDSSVNEFLLSDYHMEFDLNDKCIEYIKGIITNRTISKRNFVFIIKNANSDINRNVYLALRRLIDVNPTSKFIITSESTTFMEKSLLSRCLLVNCCFPLDNIYTSSLLQDIGVQIDKEKAQCIYNDSQSNIINFIQHINSQSQGLLWQECVQKVITDVLKEKNQLTVIMSIRETVYKLYHVGVKLNDICTYVIRQLASHKRIHDIVEIAADCEHMLKLGSKDILQYERFFLEVYRHAK
jgi:hypothetical protein